MKVSKTYFNRFKAAFLLWQEKLGLQCYRVKFKQEDIGSNLAQIRYAMGSKLAVVFLNTEFDDEMVSNDDGPEENAKHEVLHLLLARFHWLADSRCISDGDLDEENEAIVVVLEKLL